MSADTSHENYWSLDIDTAMENMNTDKLKVRLIYDFDVIYESDYLDGYLLEIQVEKEPI